MGKKMLQMFYEPVGFKLLQEKWNLFIEAQYLEIQGGGSLGFFGKFFWGGYLGLWENQGGRVLLHFRGYMRCPPPPPLCASMNLLIAIHSTFQLQNW